MSTYGTPTAPAMSRLFGRKDCVQYFYIAGSSGGYIHNWGNPAAFTQRSGGRHAEILVKQTFSQPFRGGPASPDATWYAVDELTARLETWYPGTGAFGTQFGQWTYSSPGLTTTVVPTGIPTDSAMPITPYNFTATATGGDCWVMRKGVWNVDVSLGITGTGAYTGPWDFSIYAKAYRDYTLYASFRDQFLTTTNFTGYGTHTPWTAGSPYQVVCRHNPLWDLTFKLTPDAYTPSTITLDLTFHAIRV